MLRGGVQSVWGGAGAHWEEIFGCWFLDLFITLYLSEAWGILREGVRFDFERFLKVFGGFF